MKLVFTLFLFLSGFFSAQAMHISHACFASSGKGAQVSGKISSGSAHFISSGTKQEFPSVDRPDVEEEDNDEIVKKHAGKILYILYQVYFGSDDNASVCTTYPRRPSISADSCKYILQRTLRI